MLNRLSASLEFQTQALALRSERQRLIASNIANADTPGYQAREIDFAKTLQQMTGSGATIGAPALLAGTNAAQVCAVAIVMFWNFFVNRYWTFRKVL